MFTLTQRKSLRSCTAMRYPGATVATAASTAAAKRKPVRPAGRIPITWLLPAVVLLAVCSPAARAYNPPVDSAGPLTVTIEAPDEVTEVERPIAVRVVLENKADEPIEGTLELGVIDRWRVEPAGKVSFHVPAGKTQTKRFTAVAGRGTYSAHYPIHAWARFRWQGEQLVAHPIFILQTKLPRRAPGEPTLPWRAFSLPANSQLALWQLPVRRAVVAVFGQQPQTMPTGWQGSEPASRASLQVTRQSLGEVTRQVVAIHPPWFEGRVGTLLAEFPVALPDSTPIELRFANAVTPTGEGDGVTFRVRVCPLAAPEGTFGQVIWEKHVAAKTWQEAQVDLSRFAGQEVRLQLESHPGPKNNTGWDQSYWAEPVLAAGTPPQQPAFPPASTEEGKLLGQTSVGGAEFQYRVKLGRRGLLDAAVGFVGKEKHLWFRGFEVQVAGSRLDEARSPVVLRQVKQEPCDNGLLLRHSFQSVYGSFDLLGRIWVDRGTLRVAFHLENAPEPKPWQVVRLEATATGPWSRPAEQVYAGAGNVIRKPRTFRLGFDGHRLSTSLVGFDFADGLSLVQAADIPPDELVVEPQRQFCSLRVPHSVTFTFIPADNVWEAVKRYRQTNDLKAAGGVKNAAGRFVFDLWGGHYAQSAQLLQLAFRYGLTDSMVIWHNWQRWGYDYRLPDIYPPNPQLGTLEEMKQLIATCRKVGVPIALHDNYIDFYPDAEGFSYEKCIAFTAGGEPIKAWLNEGRQARSYRYRADRVEPFLQRNLRLIKDHLQPTAYFIDVWSSIRPYDYWTADGRFYDRIFTRNCWGKHFAWIRDFLGDDAPQISESGHDQLIGWLDGAQTNHLRVDQPVGDGRYRWAVWNWKCDDAERIPWFDAAHHDRFVLHGAGYSARYQANLPADMHGIYSDDYMTTEVLTGHPAMVPAPFGRDVVRKYWLLHGVGRALALRQIERVTFVDNDLHRQHVQWSGGGNVWANRGSNDWTVEGQVLPPYGFLARIPSDGGVVEASLTRRDGVVTEMARSPSELYVNGRMVIRRTLPIRVSVEKVELADPRRLRITLVWKADAPVPKGFRPFLHFCDSQGQIVFQAYQDAKVSAQSPQGEIEATAWATLPEQCRPGESFELRVGLYRPGHGARLPLEGDDDGTGRIRLGSVQLEGKENRITAVAWTVHQPEPNPWLARQNPGEKPVDFGPVITAGACRIAPSGRQLIVTPLPGGNKPFVVRLRWEKLPWQLPRPRTVVAVALDGAQSQPQPLQLVDGSVTLTCTPNVFCYRLEP